jgi:hypothetical protein
MARAGWRPTKLWKTLQRCDAMLEDAGLVADIVRKAMAARAPKSRYNFYFGLDKDGSRVYVPLQDAVQRKQARREKRRQKMAAITSAVRQGKQGKPGKLAKQQADTVEALETIGVVPVWTEYRELKQLGFGDLVEKRTRIKDEIDFRKKKMDELDQEIAAALMVAGTEKVTWEDRPVQIVHSRSGSKIVPEKLLEYGVSASVIRDSTVPGKEYQYVLVGKEKA